MKLTITLLILFSIALPAFCQDISPIWEKYFDEKFNTVNTNITELKTQFVSFKTETDKKITDQDKCISDQSLKIAQIEAQMELMKYVFFGVLGVGTLGTGGAYARKKIKAQGEKN